VFSSTTDMLELAQSKSPPCLSKISKVRWTGEWVSFRFCGCPLAAQRWGRNADDFRRFRVSCSSWWLKAVSRSEAFGRKIVCHTTYGVSFDNALSKRLPQLNKQMIGVEQFNGRRGQKQRQLTLNGSPFSPLTLFRWRFFCPRHLNRSTPSFNANNVTYSQLNCGESMSNWTYYNQNPIFVTH